VYNGSLGIARMLAKAAAAAKAVYVVADHSKLGRTALATFGRAAAWDGLITDSSASAPAVRRLRAAGVNVILAGKARAARPARQQREMVHG
jgi:DeoR/GlpR family transcriptional regulator of sugar metabolism